MDRTRPKKVRDSTTDSTSASSARPLRKDAERTRRLVLDAAKDLFAQGGVDVGFDEIARAAGVGVGTVYRRFPDRDSLIEVLLSEKVAEILAGARTTLEVQDPWEAVVFFCERTIVEQQRDRALAQVLANGNRGHERMDALREGMSEITDRLLQRAQDAGVVRPDLEPVDLVMVTHLLSRIAPVGGAETWRRYLMLFLDAIRTRPEQEPLAGPAPTAHMFEEIARRL